MPRTALLATFSLALVACSAAAPAPAPTPELTPTIASASPIPTVIAGASTPDDDLFYRPPGPAVTTPFVIPQVTTFALPGGTRASLLERHGAAVVDLAVSVQRPDRSPASDLFLCGLILEAVAPGKRTLRDELLGLGVRIDEWVCNEQVLDLSLVAVPSRVAPAIEAITAALRAGVAAPDRVAFEQKRRVADPDASRPRRSRWLDPLLYPPRHPYHDLLFYPIEGLRKVTAADLNHARDRIRPEDLRVVAVGDLTAPALRDAVERAVAGWSSSPTKKPVAAAPAPPPAKAITPSKEDAKRQVLVVDGPPEDGVEVALVLSIPPLSGPDASSWVVLQSVLFDHWSGSLDREPHPPWSDLDVLGERRVQSSRLVMVAHAPLGAAATTLERMRDELTHFDAAPFGVDAFVRTRSRVAGWLEHQYTGSHDCAERIRYLVRTGVEPAIDEPLHLAIADLTPQGVAQVLKNQLDREPPRAFVRGPIGAEKDAIEALGLGKIKVIPATKERTR